MGALALLVLAAGAGLAGCASPAAGREPLEIRYWTGWTGAELQAQHRLVEEFNRTHPHLRVRLLSVAGSYNKVRIAFAGGATPEVCSAVWADELAGYAMRGVLRPLDDFMRRSGRRGEEYVPGVWRMLQYRGRPYGLAVTTNTQFIIYNKQLFREAGLDPERPPRTTEELDAAAQALTRTDPDGRLLRYGMRPQDLVRWAYVFGGGWYNPATGEVTANHPRNVAALRWMAEYGRRYDVSRMQNFESTFGGTSTPSGPFFVGKVGMWQTGEFALEHLRRYAPHVEWGWFPAPAPPCGRPYGRPQGRRNTTSVGGSVFVIPAACRHPEAAWEFLDWLTRPYAVGEFCESIANLPPLRALARSPRFRREPLFAFALDLAAGENAFGPPQMPVWPRYKTEIQRVEDYAVLGGQDPQQLLDALDTRMERDLARTLREAQ